MIWIEHDLYKNFLRSFNSGDINLSLDIFRSEITDLLTNKSDSFLDLLDKLKIKHRKNISYDEMLNIVLREIKENEKFVRGLAFLIGDNNNVIKNNPKISWVKLIDTIKRGIEQIAEYFESNPKAEKLFRRKAFEMVELKSSVIGDDDRELKKKDNTVLWVIGIIAVGVAGYFIYRHFNKITEDKLRAESLNLPNNSFPKMELGGEANVGGLNTPNTISKPTIDPLSLDPSYNVTPDVLIPEMPKADLTQNVSSGIQIQVQPMSMPQQNNVNSIQQNPVSI